MHAYILNYTGRTAEVSPFTSSYDALKNVPIVDAIIAYDCRLSGKTYLLVCQNALFVSSMTHNLIPPFILRETNIIVNEVPKIQIPDPYETTHSIWFPDSVFCISLSLRRYISIFSNWQAKERRACFYRRYIGDDTLRPKSGSRF